MSRHRPTRAELRMQHAAHEPAADRPPIPPGANSAIAAAMTDDGRYEQVDNTAAAWGSYRVDVYEGADGPGYTIVRRCLVGAVTYERHEHHGPERYRDRPWAAIAPGA